MPLERPRHLPPVPRAKRGTRLPVVLSRHEVADLLAQLRATVWLTASPLYGCGLRVMECVELRVQVADLSIAARPPRRPWCDPWLRSA